MAIHDSHNVLRQRVVEFRQRIVVSANPITAFLTRDTSTTRCEASTLRCESFTTRYGYYGWPYTLTLTKRNISYILFINCTSAI